MSTPAAAGRSTLPPGWLEHRLVITAALRQAGRLDDIIVHPLPAEPAATEVATWACDAPRAAALWLAGGEPTLRADLPQLLSTIRPERRDLGLCTDGLALTRSRALAPLRAAGLGRVRVTLHTARTDAHDWLVDQPGAARRALQAIRRCRAEGLQIELEAVVTRPTMPHLAELCELGAHLGASTVHLRRLVARGPAADEQVMLCARMAQLGPYLEDAVAVAQRTGIVLALHGFAHCVAPAVARFRVHSAQVRWWLPDLPAWRPFRTALERPASRHHCPSCPGEPRCEGTGADYVRRFGGLELHSEDGSTDADPLPTATEEHPRVVPPPGRAGRAPITRVWQVARQTSLALAGDPLAPRAPRLEASSLRIRFGAPARVGCPSCGDGSAEDDVEPTRAIRQRLIRAAQEGATVLRIASAGSLCHPAAAQLLEEIRLLGFERIEVTAEGSALAEWSDEELSAIGFVHRLDVPLYGPDAARHDQHMGRAGAFEATLHGLRRMADAGEVTVGAFAVLHDERGLGEYARGWSEGHLPGSPAFRLSPVGGSLRDLAAAAKGLPQGPARRALARLLPPCLLARPTDPEPQPESGCGFGETVQPQEPPSGSDRIGQLRPCECESTALRQQCPGIAVGWRLDLS